MRSSAFITLGLALAASARPTHVSRQAATDLANGKAAISDNARFKTLKLNSSCKAGEQACIANGFSQCVGNKFSTPQTCRDGTICAALPLVGSAGTTIACTTQADLNARIAATGATADGGAAGTPLPVSNNSGTGGAAGTKTGTGKNAGVAPPGVPPPKNGGGGGAVDLQTSLTLDPSVICTGFADDGQNPPVDGQTASSTSTNNYINFCALTLPDIPLTNGLQITTGSCNPAPIGLIPSVDKMPSAKFSFPQNNGNIAANKDFLVTLNVRNFRTGVFTNALKTYFAAPQTLDASGLIIGHSHVVIESLTSLTQTEPTDPKKLIFFKGINGAAVNGVLSVDVTKGIPAGAYRICTINSSSNHQPVIVPIAQHGSLDDCVYFIAT